MEIEEYVLVTYMQPHAYIKQFNENSPPKVET